MGEIMGNFIKTQNSFADGEVAPEFYARDNINGLSRLENMDVLAGGGLKRRAGLEHVAGLNSYARLIPFSVGEDDDYLLALTGGHILVFHDGVQIQDILCVWPAAALDNLQYAQRFGTMIFVHPDYQPYVLKKTGSQFTISKFNFAINENDMSVNIPFIRFDDASGINITISSNSLGGNYATFTTNKDFWTSDNVGTRLLLLNKQWRIVQYVSPTVVYVYCNGQFTIPSAAVSDWSESAFSERRGWPCSITFHQDRLVFGGSRSYPSGVWLSQVGRHDNFSVGTGLDDEAIFITLLSQQRQQICTVVSSDNLQILTSVGEWAISSKPLTPSMVDIKQHTAVGSVASRYLPPQKIEGATVFISGSKKDIRELSLDELGENYNASDLCSFAKHLMQNPIDIAYNQQRRQLFVVMASGDMAVLNQNSSLGISAWGSYKTQGNFKSVAVIAGETFVVVERGGEFALEKFSDSALTDSGNRGFSFAASALPLRGSGHNASLMRIRKITARVINTKTLFINEMRASLPNEIYTPDLPGFSGDAGINLLGCQRNCIQSPWTIQSSEPLPATVLSITVYGYYMV